MAKSRRRESRDSNISAFNEAVGAPQSTGDTRAANGQKERIAERAYELYVTRGAGDGRDLDDWLEAERDLARRRRGHVHQDD